MTFKAFDVQHDDVRRFDDMYADDDVGFEYYNPLTLSEPLKLENHPMLIEFCQSQGPMGESEQTVFRRDLVKLIRNIL
tara:strand:+ start:814 stop:1047 length:234 start_codon:yes stop_codon:yes gene_type:complete